MYASSGSLPPIQVWWKFVLCLWVSAHSCDYLSLVENIRENMTAFAEHILPADQIVDSVTDLLNSYTYSPSVQIHFVMICVLSHTQEILRHEGTCFFG